MHIFKHYKQTLKMELWKLQAYLSVKEIKSEKLD